MLDPHSNKGEIGSYWGNGISMARHNRSISIPIVLASFTVLLSITLLIGWTLLILRYRRVTNQFSQDTWLLVSGIVSFVLIVAVLVLFVVFLVREILEVRRQNSFIDSVTHELRSPLASLKLCLQTIQRSKLNQAQIEQLQCMMEEDVDRLSTFIDHVLVASRLQFGKRTYELSEVSLLRQVSEVIGHLAKRYKLPMEVFKMEISPETKLTTDKTAFEIVLNNLVDNAIKYSNDEVAISVSAEVLEEGQLSLKVIDKGIGIPPKALKKIFDRFYRVPNEEVNKRRGTGLGLFVVASLVKSLGGKLRVQSPGPNLGTTLEVLLPLDVPEK